MLRNFRQRQIFIFILAVVSFGVALVFGISRVQAATFQLTVDSNQDGSFAVLGANTTCDLREAIQAINTGVSVGQCTFAGAPDLLVDDFEIRFNIGVDTISLINELPPITSQLDIRSNTSPLDVVTLDSAGATLLAWGLRFADNTTIAGVDAGSSEVFGLGITGFAVGIQVVDVPDVEIGRDGVNTAGLTNYIYGNRFGIDVFGANATGIVISNNSIGRDRAGNIDGNALDGVSIRGAEQITIGGPLVAYGNLIAGNGRDGVRVTGVDTISIRNNEIGVLTGTTSPFGNGVNGVAIFSSQKVEVLNNSVGNNGRHGISVSRSPNTLLGGNEVGAFSGSAADVGNGFAGIAISDSNDSIVRDNAGALSIIANNGNTGITIQRSLRVAIEDTLIFDNTGLGIDLNNDGVTVPDAGDADGGANGSQNFPSFNFASTDGTTLVISGNLNVPAGNYDLIYYVNSSCDPSNFGEGEAFLDDGGGAFTSSVGAGAFIDTVTGSANGTVGNFISILAVDRNGADFGNTSEFSFCMPITDATLIPNFVPLNSTIPVNTRITLTNTSTGPVGAVEWVITGPNGTFTRTTYDLTNAFATPGVYTIELRVTNAVTGAIETISGTVTVTAPIPTLTPVIVTPVATDVTPNVTPATGIPSVTPINPTATNIPTLTPVPPTATNIPTLTPIPPTATDIPTLTPIPPTATDIPTITPIPTGTPELAVTVIAEDDDTMSVVVVNTGTGDARDVVVVENLQPLVSFSAANPGEPICTEIGGLITCRLGTLEEGESVGASFTLGTNGNSPDSGQTTVFAQGVAPVIIDAPFISKLGEPPVAPPGTEIIYTIRVVNPTEDTAEDIEITDVMPDVIEILDAEASAGDVDIDGQVVTLILDELEAGERVILTINAQVTDDLDELEDIADITNTACLTSTLNETPSCAVMTFLAAGQLPNTGQTPIMYIILQWGVVIALAGLMFVGVGVLYLRLRHQA